MILANLDQHLEAAGYKLVFPDRQSYVLPDDIEEYGEGAEQVQEDRRNEDTPPRITARSIPTTDNQRCLECYTPIQSDDFGGVCFGCYQEHVGRGRGSF